MGLLQGFVEKAPSPLMGAVDFARALMADGPDFKRGYTAENAYIATIERARREGIDIDERTAGECLGLTGDQITTCLLIVSRGGD